MTAMENPGRRAAGAGWLGRTELSPEHYLLILWHRKWLVLGIFLLVSAATAVYTYRLPDIFSSETVILVDPQQVPESYVRSTVSGDIRNRLGTLSQQILSATRLQRIIEKFNLYSEARQKLAREDVINRMRADISVLVVSDFSSRQNMEAFKITYSGQDPRLVAQVTNELASLFIEENLKARERMATGTTEFLENQLQETRGTLEEQEAKLRDFKLQHIGEMPEHQNATLQILGQLQAQLQGVRDAANRAEQQRSYIQAMMAQWAPVVDLDSTIQTSNQAVLSADTGLRAKLAELRSRYGDKHPDVVKLQKQVEEMEAAAASEPPLEEPPVVEESPPAAPATYVNPVLQAQLATIEGEIAKYKQEDERVAALVNTYRARLEAIPVREQQVADLVRDYEIAKQHYSDLLGKKLAAQTGTELEIRQKGERFTILDPAQVPERPTRPNRLVLNVFGSLGGLVLGLVMALITELFAASVSSAEQVAALVGLPVLGIIPIIRTRADRLRQRRWLLMGAASGVATVMAVGVLLLYRYRDWLF